jgi:malonyl CoA-acyl carrier protein transacylase
MHDRTRAALRLESRAVELGARKAELLHVSVPFHCPQLQPIAESLREQLRSMQIRDPQFVYVFNVKARAIRSAVGIATDLADNIAHGVRWRDRPPWRHKDANLFRTVIGQPRTRPEVVRISFDVIGSHYSF